MCREQDCALICVMSLNPQPVLHSWSLPTVPQAWLLSLHPQQCHSPEISSDLDPLNLLGSGYSHPPQQSGMTCLGPGWDSGGQKLSWLQPRKPASPPGGQSDTSPLPPSCHPHSVPWESGAISVLSAICPVPQLLFSNSFPIGMVSFLMLILRAPILVKITPVVFSLICWKAR